jgi:hypothetical protein
MRLTRKGKARLTRKKLRAFYTAIIGSFTTTSKMPTVSYGIPAGYCPLGSLLAKLEGTTCTNCYALKGAYRFPSTVRAMERRYRSIVLALSNDLERERWIEAMAWLQADRYERTQKVLKRTGKVGRDDGQFFRWHDSGDLQSIAHLGLLVEVARRTPLVRYWLPTREAGTVTRWLDLFGSFPANLTVRVSTARVDRAPAPAVRRLRSIDPRVAFSGVHSFGADELPPYKLARCGAPQNDGECGECRACWVPEVEHISYHLH